MRITIRKQKEEETVNETQLIRRCQRGDRQAFETLIRQYYDYVSGFLLKAMQDALLAQDLTQETFLKMIRSIETFDCNGAAGMGTWLVTIAKNCYVDYLRKNRIVLEDVDDTMLSDLQDKENCLLVRRLVGECLTKREADVIRRRYGLEGRAPQTQRQVAAVYGISRSYVSRIEKRALEKLEQALRERGV